MNLYTSSLLPKMMNNWIKVLKKLKRFWMGKKIKRWNNLWKVITCNFKEFMITTAKIVIQRVIELGPVRSKLKRMQEWNVLFAAKLVIPPSIALKNKHTSRSKRRIRLTCLLNHSIISSRKASPNPNPKEERPSSLISKEKIPKIYWLSLAKSTKRTKVRQNPNLEWSSLLLHLRKNPKKSCRTTTFQDSKTNDGIK